MTGFEQICLIHWVITCFVLSVCVLHLRFQSKGLVSRQRRIKRASSQNPIVDMTKDMVENERLGDFVVMPNLLSFHS